MAYMVHFGFACITLVVQVIRGCPNGWETFDGSCYFVFSLREDWITASHTCSLHHGYLAQAEDDYEDNFLKQIITKYHEGKRGDTHFWLGGDDMSKEGEWRWTANGQPFSYTNWYPGEPNNYHDQDCLLAHIRGTHFYWEDWNCTSNFNFVCESGGHWIQFG
ncbi:perlucin-like protein [Mizuhopecten yessoensis]|uniref:perlucin-like protein n=1 Tax=Mizuhopecten yessoensis TaxID=6573 RepID=UPI000B45C060|nr:perlucin-like protein [Mizuhopecten yessoensis]